MSRLTAPSHAGEGGSGPGEAEADEAEGMRDCGRIYLCARALAKPAAYAVLNNIDTSSSSIPNKSRRQRRD